MPTRLKSHPNEVNTGISTAKEGRILYPQSQSSIIILTVFVCTIQEIPVELVAFLSFPAPTPPDRLLQLALSSLTTAAAPPATFDVPDKRPSTILTFTFLTHSNHSQHRIDSPAPTTSDNVNTTLSTQFSPPLPLAPICSASTIAPPVLRLRYAIHENREPRVDHHWSHLLTITMSGDCFRSNWAVQASSEES